MPDKLVKMLSTWFYVGNIPAAPGTAASAVAVLLAVICSAHIFLYLLVLLAVTVLGFAVSGRMEDILGRKDPGCIVIDEVAGVLVALFLLPLNWPVVITAFFLFRAFDMFKIYPVNKFEQGKGGLGIMADDLVAGLYTNLVMQIAVRWAGIV
ncbi:MAG TPA: phosphatidylglycerophosphatase A [Candidatus Omnitrophota bacterium]|nr:phosphatidylglycerophosphatase A [Candidatus Omnitrophota bacterium]